MGRFAINLTTPRYVAVVDVVGWQSSCWSWIGGDGGGLDMVKWLELNG